MTSYLTITEVANIRGISRATLSAYITRKQPSAGPGWKRIAGRWALPDHLAAWTPPRRQENKK